MDSKQTSSLWTLLRLSVRLIIVSWSTSSTSTTAKGKSADGSPTSWIIEGKQWFVSVQSCVPQEGIRPGPCLFLIYINDLTETSTAQTRLFADDTAAYKVVTCPDDQTQLRDLNQLAEWEKWWDMAFHPGKCTSLPVTRSRKPLGHQYELHGQILETVSTAKYLGVTVSRDMNWSEHIKNVSTKANKTLGFLKRNLKISSRKIKEMAYKSCFRPALEYACTVWDRYTRQPIDRIEATQHQAACFVM